MIRKTTVLYFFCLLMNSTSSRIFHSINLIQRCLGFQSFLNFLFFFFKHVQSHGKNQSEAIFFDHDESVCLKKNYLKCLSKFMGKKSYESCLKSLTDVTVYKKKTPVGDTLINFERKWQTLLKNWLRFKKKKKRTTMLFLLSFKIFKKLVCDLMKKILLSMQILH